MVQNSEMPGWYSAECRVPSLHFGILQQWCVKFLSRNFLPVLATLRPKIPIRYFQPKCDQMGKIRKFLLGEGILLWNIAPVVCKVSLQEFLPILTAKNSNLVLVTWVQPVGTFDQDATGSHVWYFRLSCDYFPISVLSTRGATNGG